MDRTGGEEALGNGAMERRVTKRREHDAVRPHIEARRDIDDEQGQYMGDRERDRNLRTEELVDLVFETGGSVPELMAQAGSNRSESDARRTGCDSGRSIGEGRNQYQHRGDGVRYGESDGNPVSSEIEDRAAGEKVLERELMTQNEASSSEPDAGRTGLETWRGIGEGRNQYSGERTSYGGNDGNLLPAEMGDGAGREEVLGHVFMAQIEKSRQELVALQASLEKMRAIDDEEDQDMGDGVRYGEIDEDAVTRVARENWRDGSLYELDEIYMIIHRPLRVQARL